MSRKAVWWFCYLILLCTFCVVIRGQEWTGEDYWNSRYSGELNYVDYDTDDRENGLWSDKLSILQGNYLLPTSQYTKSCTGCVCDTTDNYIHSCTGPSVTIVKQVFENITAETFTDPSAITSIKILDCSTFSLIGNATFDLLINLQELVIQLTALKDFPDISKTSLHTLNLASNELELSTLNWIEQTPPSTLMRVALMDNNLRWLPSNMFSGTALRILSLSNNQFKFFPTSALNDVPELLYMGIDGNQLRSISKKNMAVLQNTKLQHLNISNNDITFIEKWALAQVPELKILELHQNMLSEIPVQTLHNMSSLLHLDLNNNYISVLGSDSITDLPELITLRLHSQLGGGMTAIRYNAFRDINSNLKYLWVSDNALTTFPHQVLSQQNYPRLQKIWADTNAISNVTVFGEEAYQNYMLPYHVIQSNSYVPFSTVPNLAVLYLSSNLITGLEELDFCEMTYLIELYLSVNLLTEDTIPPDVFKCLPYLAILDLNSNQIQYVPAAVTSAERLPSISYLRLASNKLTFLQAGTFTNLTTLTQLYLYSNGIISIEDGTFPSDSLTTLHLMNNEFRFLHENPFSNLDKMSELRLSNNDITVIPDTAFHNCTSLNYLDLSDNKIRRLMETHFKDSPLASNIYLQSNLIAYIEDGTFDHVTSTGDFDLSDNRLTTIPTGGDFQDLTLSNDLSLSGNYITSVPTGAFKNLVLDDLYLNDNKISYIDPLAFDTVQADTLDLRVNELRTLSSLSFCQLTVDDFYLNDMQIERLPRQVFKDVSVTNELHLEYNQITVIEADAFSPISVTKNLFLHDNEISSIEGKIFADGSSIGEWLYLSRNKIQVIPDDAFDGAAISYLTIDNNELVIYPGQALQALNLIKIQIANNQITQVPLGSFTGQTNLESLDLMSNKISVLSAGLLDPLVSLKQLIWNDNDIEKVEYGAFQALGSTLEDIYLQNNNIVFFPTLTQMDTLKTLDLSANSIETLGENAFDDVNPDTFTYLDLWDNPLGCDCNLFFTLNVTQSIIMGGECSSPTPTAGVTFVTADSADPNYFLTVERTLFLCSADNVTASAPGDYQIQVTWDAPEYTSPPEEGVTDSTNSTNSTGMSGLYHVECESDIASTLTATVSDPPYMYLFTGADGVQAGTDYTCSLRLEVNGSISAKSSYAYVTTLATLGGNLTAGDNDYLLAITHYDFSATHLDFMGIDDNVYTTPTYIPSPYGAWLAISVTPLSDSFSDWFRKVDGTNMELESAIVLEYDSGSGKHRFYDDSFFPIDTSGYGAEGQKDCNQILRNAGFTSAIRAGFLYEGSGSLSIAGGDEVWLYINKTLVLEVITDASDSTTPCKTINISSADTPGGAYITPYKGIVSGDTCVATIPVNAETVFLQLEVGDTYHFDLFHVERKPCNSRLFVETENIRFVQNMTTEDGPMDYFSYVDEDFHVGGILAEMGMTDVYSTGTNWDITITQGNEARHFEVLSDTVGNRALAVSPASPAYNYTTLPGVNVSFVECTSEAMLIPDPNVTGMESFSVSSEIALMTLATELDFEVSSRYVITMLVIEPGTSRTGQIVVRVKVYDINDNCPVLTNTSFAFEPIPALEVGHILQMIATDADSEHNAEITYQASDHEIDPPLSRYNSTMDLERTAYNETSELSFTLVAMDNGVPPRGATATVRLTLSNTCMLSVLFEPIEVYLLVDSTNGEVRFRIPKYWVYDFECLRTAGLSDGFVLDSQMSASSHEYYSPPGRARLNDTFEPTGLVTGGWVAKVTDSNQWLQVDMTEPYKYQKVMVQGRSDEPMWVTSYKIWYSRNGVSFTEYFDENGTNIFLGPNSQDEIIVQDLVPPVLAQYIRINPQTWVGGVSLRLELIGCTQSEQKYYDTTCQRCDASYYCTGDGEHQACGRCDPPQEGNTCGRSLTEHSFGAQDQCTSCPDGWLCGDGLAYPCDLYHYVECNDTYCPDTCSPCEAGYACRGGIRYQCEPGTYSDGSVEFCTLCDSGTYQNASGADHCLPCPAGSISSKMKDRCSTCPEGTWSDGLGGACQTCSGSDCRCLLDPYPCHGDVPCYNLQPDGATYACGSCPPGYYGDGVTCVDVDECTDYNPCWNGTTCYNTEPGYQCRECPIGFTGNFKDALSVDTNVRTYVFCGETYPTIQQQMCEDIDECDTNNGGCDVNSFCYNTYGSYYCGFCKEGYLGDAFYGCYSDNYCTSNKHNCSTEAECVYTGPATFRCQCSDGYTGNGEYCGPDTDLDGNPAIDLFCIDTGCFKDNCPDISNSGQEDNDGDWMGDFCDYDDDNDVIADEKDNCQYVVNFNQSDSDGDGVGDACDNCVSVNNTDQVDTDADGLGDACDDDDDGDGILDVSDNCPLVVNAGQENAGDSDSIGDACDNCPDVDNDDQTDTDQNGYGDDCDVVGDINKDRDGDGMIDAYDNCVGIPNADQGDIDSDGMGDSCDSDRDGDGVSNDDDNCPYLSNPSQADTNGNQLGDICELDTDGDGLINKYDHCPLNPAITLTTMTPFTAVMMDPTLSDVVDPVWEVTHGGREIREVVATEMPTMLIGPNGYGAIDFSGTWFVNSNEGDSYVGFVFGYHSNRKFYLVTWRHENWNYGGTSYRGGVKGVQIKLVDSSTGPGSALSNALWHSADTSGQVKVLYHDSQMIGWQHNTAYRWHLQHRPSLGIIRLRIVQGTTTIIDSGEVYDVSISGGQVGLFVFNQTGIIWSDLIVRCVEKENEAILLDGTQDYIETRNITELGLEESFTLEAYVYWVGSVPSGKLPILCTAGEEMCMFIEDGLFSGIHGNTTINGTTTLTPDEWHHLFMRYEAETHTLNLFINGTTNGPEASSTEVTPIDWTNTTAWPLVYLGFDGTSYFQGYIDEVRIYSIWLTDSELDSHLSQSGSVWSSHQRYLTLHYTMDDYSDSGLIVDSGRLGYNGIIYGNPSSVESTSHLARYEISYPDSK